MSFISLGDFSRTWGQDHVISVVILQPWTGPEAEQWPCRAGDCPALSLGRRPLCSLLSAWTQAARESVTVPTGCWGEHSGRQRDHHAEPLAKNLIFISCFMNTAKSRTLSQELLFISVSPKLEAACHVHKQKAARPPGNKFTILPKDGGVGNQAAGTLGVWDKSQFAG